MRYRWNGFFKAALTGLCSQTQLDINRIINGGGASSIASIAACIADAAMQEQLQRSFTDTEETGGQPQ
jgi:hypothetical protein